MDNLIAVGYILMAALGLGFLIFLHELGHFLLAKWNGVKVEIFSIGFGPPIVSYRKGVGLHVGSGAKRPSPDDPPGWGETEYWLAYIPLGGYVKMLGEQSEVPIGDVADPVGAATNPRAYNNKSVWARMQIITAGVVMNLILGLAFFTLVYGQGTLELPALIGGVLPGSPAYKAGLRAGDEIVAIDGRRGIGFKELLGKVNHSGAGEKLKFNVRRPGVEAELVFEIEPLRDASNPVPTIGILVTHGLELYSKTPFRALPGQETGQAAPPSGFQGNDKVVAVGPEGGPLAPVKEPVDYARAAEKARDRPLVVEVERRPKGSKPDDPPVLARVVVPTHHFLDFGIRLTAGPIAAVRPDSPAAKAGLKEGDRVQGVDGDADFDPMHLPDYMRDRAGKPIKLTLTRSMGSMTELREVTLTPDDSPIWSEPFDPAGRLIPLDVPGLGLAIAIEPKVRAVVQDSPASLAGIKVGQTLKSIVLTQAKSPGEKSRPKPVTIKLDERVGGWPLAFAAIQEMACDSVELTTDASEKPIKVMPAIVERRYHPERGLEFQSMVRQMPPLGFSRALGRGWDETLDTIFNIFRMFRGMSQGRIGGDAVGGLIPIAQIAYSAASAGWTVFIHFLGALSIGLAVLNFLPIPPLDGGQFTLLAIEKVRGRPLPDSAQNAVTIAGLVFVLGLILLINGRDLFRLVAGFFGY